MLWREGGGGGQIPKTTSQGRCLQRQGPCRLNQTEALSTVSWFNRTKEPFFKMGMAVQLLGVKQYFTSSFKLSFRSLRR